MKRLILILILLPYGIFTTTSVAQNSIKSNKKDAEKQQDESNGTKFFIDTDLDGNYETINFSESQAPQPIQGKEKFLSDFYSVLRYPASDRQKGIEGNVVLIIDVNEKGAITNIEVKKGISPGCDSSSIKAYQIASQLGYWPLIYEDKPIPFRMETMVKFSLH